MNTNNIEKAANVITTIRKIFKVMRTKHLFLLLLNSVIITSLTIRGTDAQTLHSMIFAATDAYEQTVSVGSQKTITELQNELKKVTQALNIQYDENLAIDKHFSEETLNYLLSRINPGTDDIVYFYFIGHGVNKPEIDNKWPHIALRTSFSNSSPVLVSFSEIVNQLQKKNPRLLIAMAETCNDENGRTDYYPEEILGLASLNFERRNIDILKNLYLDAKGTVVCTSSEPGQTSIISNDNGGYFGRSFLEVHKEITSLSGTADWNTIMEKTKSRTQTLVSLRSPGRVQLPQYRVNVTGIRRPDFAWQNQINNQQDVYSDQPQNFNYQANYFNPMQFLVAKVVFFGNKSNVYFVMPDNYITQYHAYYGLQIVGYRSMPLQPQYFQWDIVSYYSPFNYNRWGVDYYGRIMEWNPRFGWQNVGIVYY